MKFLSHDGLMYFWSGVKNYIDTKYNELFQSVSNGKKLVASAITGKGITTDATATFATMATNINNIRTGVETYDATAVESDVLSGKTFYKDNVKKTGSMVNIGSVPYKGSNGADSNAFNDTTMAVGTAHNDAVGAFDLTFKQGYINGSASRLHIPNLTPNKILAGVKVGWSNAYIEGTGKTESDVLNFPLSIQDTQPTAVRNGHIWVKSSTLATQITSATIVESLNAGAANNSLQFVVGETSTSYLLLRNSAKRLTNGGNNINTTSTQSNGGNQDWLVTSISNLIEYKLNRPMVYSKINNVLDVETAYMWNGSSWVLLSQKGHYVVIIGQSGIDVYNKTGDTLTAGQLINQSATFEISTTHIISKDGRIIVQGKNVYKRNGDNYSLYHTLTEIDGVTKLNHVVSGDGTRIIELWRENSAGQSFYYVKCLVDNGSSFVTESTSGKNLVTAGTWEWDHRMVVNTQGTFVAFSMVTNGTNGMYNIGYYFRNGTSWSTDGQKIFCYMTNSGNEKMGLSYDETKLMFLDGNTSGNRRLLSYNINFSNSSISKVAESPSSSATPSIYGGMSTGHVLISDGSLKLFNPTNGTVSTLTGTITTVNNIGSINLTGDRLITIALDGTWYQYQLNVSNMTVTLINQGKSRIGYGSHIFIIPR